MADKEWRPELKIPAHIPEGMHWVFEAGATAMFKAVIKYFWEPCTEHPVDMVCNEANTFPIEITYKGEKFYAAHHKDCPSCMRQLKESE